jgi:hypothetical protein
MKERKKGKKKRKEKKGAIINKCKEGKKMDFWVGV